MSGPQRHRLLHGYPMAPLMNPPGPSFKAACDAACDDRRRLILGVIPHTMCNPKVRGCGFCTFPHEPFRRDQARAVARRIEREIDATLHRWPGLGRRPVDAIYFGGGTANLTPVDDLARHCDQLASRFRLSPTVECTLEGAPVYFGTHGGAVLDAFGFARMRISMGIQTFDAERLTAMGRSHLGGIAHVERALAVAAARNATTSGDILINLPGQPREAMLADVKQAADLGLDQVCLYHLVLFERLGTPWAQDPAMLAALPSNTRAYENWAAARSVLLERGYVQRTLTNFERAEVPAARQFAYEHLSFHPEDYDALGFGPAGISTLGGRVKWCNAATGRAYLERDEPRERSFIYGEHDRRLLFITRKLPLLAVNRGAYAAAFATTLEGDFGFEIEALSAAGLLRADVDAYHLTPRGMFFADSAAGLFAWRRTRALRGDLAPNLAEHSMMG